MSDSPSRKGYALVTGGAVRLGAYIARKLASEGWAIAIHHREHHEEAKALAAEINVSGGRAFTLIQDLADAEGLASIFTRANAHLGFCSLLVNSASAFTYDDVGDVSAATMDPLYEVNF